MKKSKLMVAALLGLFSTGIANAELSKDGDYYLIGNFDDLKEFAELVEEDASVSAKLTGNIDAENAEFGAMASSTDYSGHFDGAGHSISNIKIEGTSAGLFAYTIGATISNLTLKNASASGHYNAGGIVGYATSTTITACGFEGDATATASAGNTGGICGYAEGGTISYCYSTGDLEGNRAAGIANAGSSTTINNCYSAATLVGANNYGITDLGTKTNCYFLGDSDATEADFESGKIAYLLNAGNASAPFKQTLGTEMFPTLMGTDIVYAYSSCHGTNDKFTNDAALENTKDSHVMTEHAAQAATCTETGSKAYWTCANEAGVFFKDAEGTEKFESEAQIATNATGHKMIPVAAKEATCEVEGNHLYYTCLNESSDIYYKDAEGNNKYASKEDAIIPATGHDYEKHIQPVSVCSENDDNTFQDYTYYTCKNNSSEYFIEGEGGIKISATAADAIKNANSHNWESSWHYEKTSLSENGIDSVDTYIRHCLTNSHHIESVFVDHKWSEWKLVKSVPVADMYERICKGSYGEHKEIRVDSFNVEKAKYYSQATATFKDTLIREGYVFKANTKSKNDLLFVDSTATTIKGNNVIVNGVCEKLVITDGYAFNAPEDSTFVAETLEFTRKSDDKYASLVVPFDIPLDHINGQVYTFSNSTSDPLTITFSKMTDDTLKAGTPCLISSENEKIGKIVNNINDVTIARCDAEQVKIGDFTFLGGFSKEIMTQDDFLSLYSDKGEIVYGFNEDGNFVWNKDKNGTLTIGAFRCKLQMAFVFPTSTPTLGIIFDDDTEGLTGVVSIEADGSISAGNVDVYDMAGRLIRKNAESATCLQGLKKGVYVVNGKKLVKTTND